MSHLNSWRSGTSLLLALTMMGGVAAPIVMPGPATAQLFPDSLRRTPQESLAIPAGVAIPVRYDKAEKVVLSPKETVSLTLAVASNLRTRNGTILIPRGSQVIGQLRPADGGSQFIANELNINGKRYYIDASSNVITRTEEVRPGINTGSVLRGAVYGAAAAAAISGITGDRRITVGKVLTGVGVGAVGGLVLGKNKAEVVVINPNSDLTLTLNSDLALR